MLGTGQICGWLALNSPCCCLMYHLNVHAKDPYTIMSTRELRALVQTRLWTAKRDHSGRCLTCFCWDESNWHCQEKGCFLRRQGKARVGGSVCNLREEQSVREVRWYGTAVESSQELAYLVEVSRNSWSCLFCAHKQKWAVNWSVHLMEVIWNS
jgi:hypothetical protein